MSNLTKKDLTQLTDVNKQIEELLRKKEEQEQKLFTAVGKQVLKYWKTPEYPDSLMATIKELSQSANLKMESLDNVTRAKNLKKKEDTSGNPENSKLTSNNGN